MSQKLPCALHLPPPGRPRWVCPPGARLDLLYLGWGKRRFGPNPIPPSRHPGWVYFLVHSGNPVLCMENRKLRLAPGRIVIVGPDCASGWTDAQDAVAEVLTWVWRTPPRCTEYAPTAGGCRDSSADAALRRTMQQAHSICRAEVKHPTSLTTLTLEQARLQMDLAFARSLQPRAAAPEPAMRLKLALDWLAENLTASNPITGLCEYLQISPVTLNRLFHAYLHESAAVHHNRLRMERAAEMLGAGQAVKKVAYALGYRHPNDFSRAFKKRTGRNPGGTSDAERAT